MAKNMTFVNGKKISIIRDLVLDGKKRCFASQEYNGRIFPIGDYMTMNFRIFKNGNKFSYGDPIDYLIKENAFTKSVYYQKIREDSLDLLNNLTVLYNEEELKRQQTRINSLAKKLIKANYEYNHFFDLFMQNSVDFYIKNSKLKILGEIINAFEVNPEKIFINYKDYRDIQFRFGYALPISMEIKSKIRPLIFEKSNKI